MRERLSTSYVWLFFLLIVGSMSAQQIEISGTVKDNKGEPLLGVFILVKGTQRGATTDFDGHYSLKANVGDVLKFSFLGMKTVEKKLTAGTKELNITMQEDVQQLEGTVVVQWLQLLQ